MADATRDECAGGGLVPTSTQILPTAGEIGVCPMCRESLVLDETRLIPRHYPPGHRREGHESVAFEDA
jgi:hypothetical protein